jgi:hypothetical protein
LTAEADSSVQADPTVNGQYRALSAGSRHDQGKGGDDAGRPRIESIA